MVDQPMLSEIFQKKNKIKTKNDQEPDGGGDGATKKLNVHQKKT